MSSGATGAAEDGYPFGAIQKVGEDPEFFSEGQPWLRLRKMHPRPRDGIPQGHVARNGNGRNASPRDCGLHCDLEDARHLLRLRDQFTVVTALREELIRMGLLKISAADFRAGNLRGDSQDRYAAPMAIVQAID